MLSFDETSRFTEVGGAQVYYNEAGSGPPLLGFHGGGPGANGWDNTKWIVDALAERFRVVLVDLPGYGYTDAVEQVAGENLDDVQVRTVLGLMDALEIDRAHLFGPSASATTCIRIAHGHPDRVDRLALTSPAFGPPLLSVSPPDGIRALARFLETPTHETMTAIMELFVPRPGLLTEDMVEARFASALREKERNGAFAMELAMRQRPAAATDVRALLPELRPPVLVTWGHQDRMVPLDYALVALAHIPDVRLHVWGGGAGHFVELEHPAEFSRLLIDFLDASEDVRTPA